MICAAMTERMPHLRFEIVKIVTHGDRFGQKPIVEMGEEVEKGIFNTALEDAVLDGRVDFSTCSFKDVQSELRPNLTAVSVCSREDHRDVLVTRHHLPLAELPEGAVLATSSPRRTSQLKAFRPDFAFAPLRGNITTRVGSAAEQYDGVIVAAAGLIRMGLEDRISEWIGEELLLPAAAQAAMGCEYHSGREDIAGLIASIQDAATELCVRAEKKLLVTLSGGCFAPIGVLARVEQGTLHMRCRVVSLDGKRRVEDRIEGDASAAETLVSELAEKLADRGAREIIQTTRAALQTTALL
jgi:hydroxymethylbilane synthase